MKKDNKKIHLIHANNKIYFGPFKILETFDATGLEEELNIFIFLADLKNIYYHVEIFKYKSDLRKY